MRATLKGALLAGLLAFGCAHGPKPPVEEVDPGEYRIGREDTLDISVWRDPDLSRTVPVRPDGMISLPLVGELPVAGKTAAEVAGAIRERLAPYVEEPRVAVIVREINSPRIFVLGEVAHPGTYPLRGRLTVLQALSLAGGTSEFADKSGVVIMREQPKRERFEIDVDRLVGRDGPEGDVPLRPGDTVYVP